MTIQVVDISSAKLLADPLFNSRGAITADNVRILSNDIKEHGLLQPIVVQPWDNERYRVVCGHRRHMAMTLLGWATMPCIIREDLSEEMALALNLSENVKRDNLNPLQEAMVIQRFIAVGWTVTRMCKELGVNQNWVKVRIKLLELPPEIQARAATGFLTQHQILDIAAKPTRFLQIEACKKAVNWKLQGERGSLKVGAKKRDLFKKGGPARSKEELFEMQEHIQDVFSQASHPMARALAWAAGVISSVELCKDLAALAEERGLSYDPMTLVRSKETA